MDAEELLEAACVDGISCLSEGQLLVVIAEALATDVGMSAEELLAAACDDGIACLSPGQLLVVIAEGLNQGITPPPPPGESCCNAGIGSPEGVVVGSPGSTYLDTATDNFWVKETGTSTNTGWVPIVST